MPLKVFTLYNTNIDRIRAEEEMRQLRILNCSQTENAKEVVDRLIEELGSTIETEKTDHIVPMDTNAYEKLMAGMQG